MADIKVVAGLDQRLMEEGIIDPKFKSEYGRVHRILNTKIPGSGKRFTEETFARGEGILRTWLSGLSRQGESVDKLTSCLRCGLAHLSYDLIEAYYDTLDTDYLATRAYASFKKRDYHRTHFMALPEEPRPEKKTGQGRTSDRSASAAKKKTAGKSAGKAVKSSSKKKSVKKGAAKAAGKTSGRKKTDAAPAKTSRGRKKAVQPGAVPGGNEREG